MPQAREPHASAPVTEWTFQARTLNLGTVAAVLVGMHGPRPEPGALRAELERKTDSAEAEFMEYRAAVRRCPTFLALDELERAETARMLFDVRRAQPD